MNGPQGCGRIDKSQGDPAWLQRPMVWVLLCLAAALPLVWPAMPPLIDLGGHLGRFAVQVDGGRSADLRQWYSFHWDLIPNLGCDLLMQVLAPVLGLEPALKAIVMAIPVIQCAGFLLLARAAHGYVPATTLFALPLAYSYPFQFGFINFTLCTGLATCALALWITLHGRPALRWALFVPISCLLWLCHLVGWSIFCIFAASDVFMRWYGRPLDWRGAVTGCVLPLSCLAAPLLIKALWPGAPSGHGETTEFHRLDLKLNYLYMVLRDRWMVWDVASALLLAGLIVWGWRSQRCTVQRGLALGTCVLAVLYAVMPGTIFGSHYADMRLVPVLMAMAIIALRPAPGAGRHVFRGLAIAGVTFTASRCAGNAASFALLDRQFNADLALLDRLPRASTLISIAPEACHAVVFPWQRERRFHLGGYAIARRHDFSNDQWIIPGGQLLGVHNAAAGAFAQDPSEMAKTQDCKGKPSLTQKARLVPRAMNYLWILEDGQPRPIPGWRPVLTSQDSVIYSPG